MYISNLKDINTNYYQCGKTIGKYLIRAGIPLLSQNDNNMMFAKTRRLQKAIDNMPFYLKILVKGGVING